VRKDFMPFAFRDQTLFDLTQKVTTVLQAANVAPQCLRTL
jgi:hypothetical protein